MENIKEIVRENVVSLRKENKLTQLELSQKIGYSDKAISRWETGETTPDVETLSVLAKLYNVDISYFFEAVHSAQIEEKQTTKKRASRLAISLLCIVSVWFIAIVVFDVLNKVLGARSWMAFIWAIPLTFLLAIIFNSIWGKKIWTFIFASIFSWSMLLAFYLQFINYSSFMLFIAGVPIQALIIIAYFLKKQDKKSKAQ